MTWDNRVAMLKTHLATIEDAIHKGRRMAIMYGGKYREVYPHILTKRANFWCLYAVHIRYDTNGLSFRKPEWQYITVDHIKGNIVVFGDEQDQA
jgi:hypothetical protein